MSFLRKSTFSKLISNYFKSLINKNSQHVNAKKAAIYQQKQAITKRKVNANHAYSNLTFMCVVATGYYVYKEFKESIKSKKSPYMYVPSVQAASSFEGAPLSGRRSKFNFIADVVETSAPAVVYIEIKDHRRVDFFTGRPTTISNGSGFIIDSNGLILTNAHVVTNKTNAKVEVKLIDGSIYQGQVEDIDLKSDLATVRIPAKKLPVMKLGNSSDLKPGEFVVAIGSPLALSNTVTSGVVSSTHRGSAELGLMGKDMVYIQTDAAITFGNSGGPLVNLDGEAIGVNSMKVTAGISFAIPIDYVKAFLKSATGPKKTNNQKRMYLGITMLTLTPQIIFELQQRNHDVPRDIDRGVLVWKVIYGSPAHLGGLLPGDIVTHIDGKTIQHSNDVYGFLEGSNSREMRLSVNRSGRKMEVIITPEDLS